MRNEQVILLNIRLKKPARIVETKKPKEERPRVLPMHKGKLLSIVAMVALFATGCSGSYMGDYDLVILGNEKGLERLTDHNIGLVNEGKTKQGEKSYHYELREKQTGIEELRMKLQEMKNRGK